MTEYVEVTICILFIWVFNWKIFYVYLIVSIQAGVQIVTAAKIAAALNVALKTDVGLMAAAEAGQTITVKGL